MSYTTYLTRQDIAQILKVSLKQAGRLMCEMPVLQISKKQRRVSAEDFEAWCQAKRVASVGTPQLRVRRWPPSSKAGRALIEAARGKTKPAEK